MKFDLITTDGAARRGRMTLAHGQVDAAGDRHLLGGGGALRIRNRATRAEQRAGEQKSAGQ